MVEILDGPAEGESLSLRRSPLFLRVVRSRTGHWDGLDQLDDQPKATETIFVYLRHTQDTPIHFKMQRRSESGWYARATYKLFSVQPADCDARDKFRWQEWCVEQAKKNPGQ